MQARSTRAASTAQARIPADARQDPRVKEAQRSAEIALPAAEVFAFLSNLENLPRWQSGVVRAEQTSSGAIGVGSTAVVERRKTFDGKRCLRIYERSSP